MKKASINAPHAWAKPLVWTRDEIRRRVARPGPVLTNLQEVRAADRGPLIQKALEEVYTPTEQTLDVLQRLLGIGIEHANRTYSTKRSFCAQVHALDIDATQSGIVCLTGLAGIGKTSLASSLARLLPQDLRIEMNVERVERPVHQTDSDMFPFCGGEGISNGLSSFPVKGVIHLPIKNSLTTKEVLGKLLGELGNRSPVGSGVTLETEARRKLYGQGVSLLLADEMQKLTGSVGANTKVTQLIYTLSELGLPLLYIANFSLCHKLLKRFNEDKRRLFADVIVMRPEAAESKDWKATVNGYLAVLPDAVDLDAHGHAEQLHDLSGGINYILIKLLKLACERALKSGRAASIADVEWVAQRSERFHSERIDLERLRRQSLTGQSVSQDLWCPFDEGVMPVVAQREKQRFQAEVARAMVTPSAPSSVARSRSRKSSSNAAGSKVRSLDEERNKQIQEGMRRLAAMQHPSKPSPVLSAPETHRKDP